MSGAALLHRLRTLGATLTPVRDRLRVEAPKGVLTPELKSALAVHKIEILRLLAPGLSSQKAVPQAPSIPIPAPPETPGAIPVAPEPSRVYAFPWPDAIPSLGRRRVQAFDLCVDCRTGSWVAYGEIVLCLSCALRRAREAG